jgi:hypothetical protein
MFCKKMCNLTYPSGIRDGYCVENTYYLFDQ